METQELTSAYLVALTDLARERGVDVALQAASITLAQYHASQSAGFFRGREPLLFMPTPEGDSDEPQLEPTK